MTKRAWYLLGATAILALAALSAWALGSGGKSAEAQHPVTVAVDAFG